MIPLCVLFVLAWVSCWVSHAGAALRGLPTRELAQSQEEHFKYLVVAEHRSESDDNDDTVICMERAIAYNMDDFAEEYLVDVKKEKDSIEWGDVNNVTYKTDDLIISLGIDDGEESIYIWRRGFAAGIGFGPPGAPVPSTPSPTAAPKPPTPAPTPEPAPPAPVTGAGAPLTAPIKSTPPPTTAPTDVPTTKPAPPVGGSPYLIGGWNRRELPEKTGSRVKSIGTFSKNEGTRRLATEPTAAPKKELTAAQKKARRRRRKKKQLEAAQKKERRKKKNKNKWRGAFKVRAECTLCNPDNLDQRRTLDVYSQSEERKMQVTFESFMNDKLADQIVEECDGVSKVTSSTFTYLG